MTSPFVFAVADMPLPGTCLRECRDISPASCRVLGGDVSLWGMSATKETRMPRITQWPGGLLAQVDATPNNGFPGADLAQNVLDWLMWLGLAGSLASLLVGGAVWGLSQVTGNSMQGGRGRMFALGGAAGAIVTGLAPTIVNELSGL